jgi:hypothetical protein
MCFLNFGFRGLRGLQPGSPPPFRVPLNPPDIRRSVQTTQLIIKCKVVPAHAMKAYGGSGLGRGGCTAGLNVFENRKKCLPCAENGNPGCLDHGLATTPADLSRLTKLLTVQPPVRASLTLRCHQSFLTIQMDHSGQYFI